MRVRWTPAAVDDLTRICDYIEQNSSGSARNVALKLYQGVTILEDFPQLGRVGRKQGTRELPIRGLPYLAIYRLRGETIELVRILHGAQEWP